MRREPISRVTLPDGRVRYRVRTDAGTRPDGSRLQVHATFDTLREARNYLARVRTEARDGSFIGKSRMTVKQQYEAWLAGKRKLRPSTVQRYRDVADRKSVV